MLDRRRALGGFAAGAPHQGQAAGAARRQGLRGAQARARASRRSPPRWRSSGSFKELMQDKEIGTRIVPIIPDEARTFGMDSLFPTPEDLQPARAAVHLGRRRADAGLQGDRDGPDPARGHQRGRLDGLVHRGRHVVRHPRRADDPDLHLLLDVRVPAHRRRRSGRRPTRWPAASCSAPPPAAPR